MWPLNTRPNEERRPRLSGAAASRAPLSVVRLIGFALTLQAEGAAGSPALREKDVRRAEKVVEKLRLLDEAAAAREGSTEFRGLAAKFYLGLFMTVADMRRSDLKTDLDTAVFLYAEVGRVWFTTGNSLADCHRQRRDTYLPLCLDLRGSTVRQLLLSKARLVQSQLRPLGQIIRRRTRKRRGAACLLKHLTCSLVPKYATSRQ